MQLVISRPAHAKRICFKCFIFGLFELEFEEGIYAMAVECKISVRHLSNIGFKNKKYFNAGVIYFDYQKCLENNVFKKALNLLMIDDKYDFMDQDVLNIVLEKHVKYISPKWNYSGFSLKLAPSLLVVDMLWFRLFKMRLWLRKIGLKKRNL